MKTYDRWELFGKRGETEETWLWCVHCERCYQIKDIRRVTQGRFNLEMCGYEGCSGDSVMDAFNWDETRSERDLPPLTPQRGKEYRACGIGE